MDIDASDLDMDGLLDELGELDLELEAVDLDEGLSEIDLDGGIDDATLTQIDGGLEDMEISAAEVDEFGDTEQVDPFLNDETFDRSEWPGGSSQYAGGDGETSYFYDSNTGYSVIPGEGVSH